MVEVTEFDKAVFDGAREPVTSSPCVNQVAGNLDPSSYPLVSIGLPVFNGAATLSAALETLVRQDHPNIKIIISDNASTDSTLDICDEFARRDPRIRIIRKQVNEGPVANFRSVLNAAEGDFFMWAAADDFWHPQFISRLLPTLKADSSIGVAMCAVERQFPDGSPFDLIRFNGENDPSKMSHMELLRKILSGIKYNLFIYGLFRTHLLQLAMRNFPNVLGGDRLFICQIALACGFGYVDEVLLTRTHQPKNCDAYMVTMSKCGTLRRQLFSFTSMLLSSRVIPWWRKACLPIALTQYLWFGIRQKRYVGLDMIKKILRAFYITPKQLLPAIGLMSVAILFSSLLIYLDAISLEFTAGIFSVTVLFIASMLLLRRWIIQFQKTIQAMSSIENQKTSQLLSELHTLTNQSKAQSSEMRFLTDALLHPELSVTRIKGNVLSSHLIERIEKHRKTVDFVRNLEESLIREVYIQELFPGIENVSVPIGVINEVTGHANKVDMLYVSAVAKHVGAMNMFEFGTYMGRTTYYLAHNNPNGKVTTLNLPPERDPRYGPYLGVLFKGFDEEKRIAQIHMDSREFDTAQYRRQFDFVFVDGDHSYDLVMNDTQKAFDLIKEGGIIIWHDYAPKSEGLVRFFREFTQDRPLFRIRSTCLLVYIDGVDVMSHELGHLPHSIELEYREENPYLVESIYHS